MNKETAQAFADLQGVARRVYAMPSDFCLIFEQEMHTLYSLALLLTGDRQTAEKCFLAALDDCRTVSDVFREWAQSWSRRAIIKQAIRQVHPRPDAHSAAESVHETEGIENIPQRLLQLPPFERFVFGMAVLEGYRARECATLLDCRAGEVQRARVRTLQLIGGTGQALPTAALTGSSNQEAARRVEA